MADPSRYPIPAARARAEESIDRSRFICTLAPAPTPEAAQTVIAELRDEFSDATHNCWAFVAGPPGSTARIGMSDDGEPHGTAGRPMLTVLLHSGVGEIVAVVTRYYGGTKLGTGGLVRAYSQVVQSALATLPRRERMDYAQRTIAVAYSHVSAIRHLLPTFEATLDAEEYTEQVRLTLRAPALQMVPLLAAVGNATSGQAVVIDDTA
jgi:uncharacterized YigZ family protein